MRAEICFVLIRVFQCHLATNDLVAVNRALENYRELDPSFASQREHQLLCDLAEAIERGDQEMFADKLVSGLEYVR